ncbi:glycosyltransferase [Mongoliitalea daihaiensis]|uniref:glycosyltransferase n=1 Tax=Mongoliitalea daihaiensis TaxID=2782006 RepID=UPI001F318799|nr:glycosyltransferase [Mongoliitalea daihaiensis]UJP65515.1 glycosyltransferase [Mongoliitalea daihaiensis]
MLTEILLILFLVAATVQFFYILVIFGRATLFYRAKASKSTTEKLEGVTVVIAARNEKENLSKLIPIICNQNYPNFDIMVVNDRSNDGTKALLEQLMSKYPKLRTVTIQYTPEHVTAKKYALTLGIKVVKNDVLLLTDADCIPQSEDWITLMTAPVRNEGRTFALGFSPYATKGGFLNQWIQFETCWTALLYASFTLWKAPFMGVGRNLCYRRSFFMEQKAFKGLWEVEGGDDDLLVNRYATSKNTGVVIDPRSITLSEPKQTWSDYYTQKKRHLHAGKYYKAKDKQKIGIYALTHLIFWILGIGFMFYSGIEQNWEHFAVILGIITVRSILLTSVFTSARKKMTGKTKLFWTGAFDLLYIGYFWIVGTIGYQSRKVRWK